MVDQSPDKPTTESGKTRVVRFTKILGTQTVANTHVRIVGETQVGEIAVDLPAESIALLGAVFASYAAELKSSLVPDKNRAYLSVKEFELRGPKDSTCHLTFVCNPDLTLHFALPIEGVRQIGEGFMKAVEMNNQPNATPEKTNEGG